MMPVPSLDALTVAARSVALEAGLELVVVFGSVARSDPAPHDVDLGVISAGPADLLDATNRFVQATGTSAVDVVDLRRANPVLLMCVAREGIPLYESRPSRFTEFASLAMRRYADTKKFRDAVRDELRAYAAGQP